MSSNGTSRSVAIPDTLPQLFAQQSAAKPSAPAVSWKRSDGAQATLNWAEYRELVLNVAAGFLRLGLEAGETVAILAGNRVEHLAADLAASHCAAASVSVYQTLAPDQLNHVIADAAPRVIVVEPDAVDRIAGLEWVIENRPALITLGTEQSVLPTDESGFGVPTTWAELLAEGAAHFALLRDEIDKRISTLKPDDPITYIYTSGTTGPSKGVILTHRNVLWDAMAMARAGAFTYEYRVVAALPMAHVAERLWSVYVGIWVGGHVYCCPDSRELVDAVQRHRPSFFMSVPRVWEKLADGARMLMGSAAFAGRAEELAEDRKILAEEWRLRIDDAQVPAKVRTCAELAREGIVREVGAMLGLDRVQLACVGAAPMREDVDGFFASIGLYIHHGYGLTETGGVAVSDRLGGQRRGSVGLPAYGFEVRIADDGEIQLKGPSNSPGYRNLEQATAELYTPDGWLCTGDVGRLDEAGRVYITDRKKEILVNAAGKNIAPTAVESLVSGREFVDQAMIVGEGRSYVVALLTIDPAALKAFGTANGIEETSTEELVGHPAVLARVQSIVDAANARLSRPEQIKHFALLPAPWRVESGELTPTLKLRRKVIIEHCAHEIEALYKRPAAARSQIGDD
jgi:long-chain acyl-CoA synthetase